MRGISVLLVALLLLGCDPGVVYKEYEKFSGNVWHRDVVPEFEVEINDPAKAYNKVVMLRHGGNFPYEVLVLEVAVVDPAGNESAFDYTVTLVDQDGDWLSDGMGNTFDFEIPVLQEMDFSEAGSYKIRVAQKMQQDLPLVVSVGFKVYEA